MTLTMSPTSTQWPLISVVVLTYNHESYIASCLRSIGVIDYPSIEVHVLDDGSQDSTVERALEVSSNSDVPMYIETQAHSSGATGANSNKLLAAARGDLVLFLAGDDALEPGYNLRQIVEKMQQDERVVLALPRAVHVHMGSCASQTSIYDPAFAELLRSGDPQRLWDEHLTQRVSRIFLQGVVMPRAACAAFGGFDEGLLADDYAFVMRAFDWMRLEGKKFVFFEDHIWLYRVHPRNVHANNARQRRLVFEVVSKYVPQSRWADFRWDHVEPAHYSELRALCDEIGEFFGEAAQQALLPQTVKRFCHSALRRKDVAALIAAFTDEEFRPVALRFVLPRLYRLLSYRGDGRS